MLISLYCTIVLIAYMSDAQTVSQVTSQSYPSTAVKQVGSVDDPGRLPRTFRMGAGWGVVAYDGTTGALFVHTVGDDGSLGPSVDITALLGFNVGVTGASSFPWVDVTYSIDLDVLFVALVDEDAGDYVPKMAVCTAGFSSCSVGYDSGFQMGTGSSGPFASYVLFHSDTGNVTYVETTYDAVLTTRLFTCAVDSGGIAAPCYQLPMLASTEVRAAVLSENKVVLEVYDDMMGVASDIATIVFDPVTQTMSSPSVVGSLNMDPVKLSVQMVAHSGGLVIVARDQESFSSDAITLFQCTPSGDSCSSQDVLPGAFFSDESVEDSAGVGEYNPISHGMMDGVAVRDGNLVVVTKSGHIRNCPLDQLELCEPIYIDSSPLAGGSDMPVGLSVQFGPSGEIIVLSIVFDANLLQHGMLTRHVVGTTCPSGYISMAGTTNCVQCSSGTFVNGTKCSLCVPGTYAPDPGLLSCLPCDTLEVCPFSGSASPLPLSALSDLNGGVTVGSTINSVPETEFADSRTVSTVVLYAVLICGGLAILAGLAFASAMGTLSSSTQRVLWKRLDTAFTRSDKITDEMMRSRKTCAGAFSTVLAGLTMCVIITAYVVQSEYNNAIITPTQGFLTNPPLSSGFHPSLKVTTVFYGPTEGCVSSGNQCGTGLSISATGFGPGADIRTQCSVTEGVQCTVVVECASSCSLAASPRISVAPNATGFYYGARVDAATASTSGSYGVSGLSGNAFVTLPPPVAQGAFFGSQASTILLPVFSHVTQDRRPGKDLTLVGYAINTPTLTALGSGGRLGGGGTLPTEAPAITVIFSTTGLHAVTLVDERVTLLDLVGAIGGLASLALAGMGIVLRVIEFFTVRNNRNNVVTPLEKGSSVALVAAAAPGKQFSYSSSDVTGSSLVSGDE